jgi:hypothetical protein
MEDGSSLRKCTENQACKLLSSLTRLVELGISCRRHHELGCELTRETQNNLDWLSAQLPDLMNSEPLIMACAGAVREEVDFILSYQPVRIAGKRTQRFGLDPFM